MKIDISKIPIENLELSEKQKETQKELKKSKKLIPHEEVGKMLYMGLKIKKKHNWKP